MGPFYGWGSTVSRLQSQYKETVYFLLVILQELLVISGMKGQYIMSYFYKPFRFLYKKFGKFSLKELCMSSCWGKVSNLWCLDYQESTFSTQKITRTIRLKPKVQKRPVPKPFPRFILLSSPPHTHTHT